MTWWWGGDGGRGLFGVSERGGVMWVQGSHSLGEKAVEQSGGAGSETVGGMGGVLHDTFCFAGASCKENIQDGGERGPNDFCSGVHCSLEGLAVCCTTVPVPDSDAAGQHALNGSPVEGGEDGWREACSFQPAEKV